MKKPLIFSLCLLLSAAVTGTGLACVWGSFDGSRINYAAGPLNGTAHATLRTIIVNNGGTVAAGTPFLTPEYLATVDVFYTSLLSTSTGVLSGDEQTALYDWIAGGGTLIVTADIFPLPAYESFTAYYGVTGYTSIGASADGFPVTSHPITDGVTVYHYVTNSTFTYGADALLLGNDGQGHAFMIVMEPATGFDAGGRILVIGDHNMFTESYIGQADNTILANNFAAWACSPEPVATESTSWGRVKALYR